MKKKLNKEVGNFTHVDVIKIYANGTVDCDMLIVSEQEIDGEKSEVEQYREKGTSFCEPYPFELTESDIELLMPKVSLQAEPLI